NGVFDQQIDDFDGYKGSTYNLEWSRSYRFGAYSADLDNNGTIDIIYWTPDNLYFYMNDGSAFQNYLPVIGLSSINNIDIADLDSDGDVDFMVNADNTVRVYENATANSNTAPTAPVLTAPDFDGSTVEINWSPSSDSETNSTSISYNLRVGSSQGESDILSPEAHSNGMLLKPTVGNLGKDTTHSLIVKAGTKIYYSIQAVDPNFSTSAFSIEDSLVVPGSPFTPMDVSFSGDLLQDIAWGDYDNDEDLDLLSLTTEKDSFNVDMFGNMPDINKVRIYLNESGNINRSNEADFIYEGESYINSTYWLDYDGDNDLDIFVKRDGRDILYRSDSNMYNRIDNFITNDNWHFESNDISFGDFDNDGDLDILYKKWNRVVLLRNLDNIRYDEVQVDLTQVIEGSEFYYVNLYNSVAEFGDYDNDGDFDILVAGDGDYYKPENNEWVPIKYVNLLNNNGKGEFNKVEADITGEDVKKIEWIDFDNDGDLDIFLRFADRDYYDPAVAQDKTYKLYRNNDGVFENVIVDLKGVGNINDAAWGDFDNDGDLDIAIRGQYRFNDWDLRYKISLYMNKGDGTFSYIYTDVDDISFVHGSSSMAWGDYDDDGDLDLIVSGRADYDNSVITKIFRNDYSVPNSAPSAPSNLQATQDGYKLTFEWDPSTDAENGTDGLTYNLRVGTTMGGSEILSAHVSPGGKLLLPGKGNVENNTSFSINTLTLSNPYFWSVQAVDAGYAASDFTDNVLVVEEPFYERTDVDLAEVKDGTSAWGDYDNDGDLDLLITGASNAGYVANLYRNDAGVFVNTSTLLKRMASGDVAWGDYDNDGDLDLIMSGSDVYANASTVIYINEGSGVLTESSVADNITQVFNSSLAWGDYDDDGDLDLAIAGYSIEERSDIFHLFKNENNEFVKEEGFNAEGFENGNVEWADMDNDGDIDLVYSGMNNSLMATGGIIYNNKIQNEYWWWGGVFNQGFDVMNSVFDLGDYDSDGDLDILY
ncbi:FG-GAP repeat domain-containing protein, partial [Bacteroidota bacterium]